MSPRAMPRFQWEEEPACSDPRPEFFPLERFVFAMEDDEEEPGLPAPLFDARLAEPLEPLEEWQVRQEEMEREFLAHVWDPVRDQLRPIPEQDPALLVQEENWDEDEAAALPFEAPALLLPAPAALQGRADEWVEDEDEELAMVKDAEPAQSGEPSPFLPYLSSRCGIMAVCLLIVYFLRRR